MLEAGPIASISSEMPVMWNRCRAVDSIMP